MENTRIYKILSKLTKSKLNRFSKFIESPYFNVNKSISSLCEYLIDCIKKGKELHSKSEIWLKVQDKSVEYNDLKFRKLCNDLLDRYEKFLTVEKLTENKLLQANLLLDSIKEENQSDLTEKHISKSSRLIDREINQSADYYLQQYYYDKNIYNLKTNYERKADIKKFMDQINFGELSNNLDIFYVIERLRHATDFLTWRKLYKSDSQIDLAVTLELIEKYNLKNIPAVKVYYLMYHLMADEASKDSFLELKQLAQERIDSFPKEERKEILDVLLSYCIKDVNKGDKSAYSEVLDLYDWGIQTEIILEKGYLSPTTYRNYVVIALRDGRFDQAENFITNNAHLLENSRKDNAINFNFARVSFYKKDFSNVLSYLNNVNYDDVWYNMNSRNILLISYYELEEFDTLEYQIESFLTFLRREKSINLARKQKNINLTKYIKLLVRKRENKKELRDLRPKIEADTAVNNKAWLLEKIDELI